MIKSLIYKEWIKTRWFILLSMLVGLIAVVNIFFSVHSSVSSDAVGYINGLIMSNDMFFYSFRFVPIIMAVLIGFSQYIPEILEKRIKLSLHLPLGSLKVIYSMVVYGFVVMSVMLMFNLGLMLALFSIDLPSELIIPALNTMIPWLLGGVTAYFLIAMISLEPIGFFRFLYAIFAYFYVELFMRRYGMGDAVSIIPVLVGAMIFASLSPIYTAHRFNKGEL